MRRYLAWDNWNRWNYQRSKYARAALLRYGHRYAYSIRIRRPKTTSAIARSLLVILGVEWPFPRAGVAAFLPEWCKCKPEQATEGAYLVNGPVE